VHLERGVGLLGQAYPHEGAYLYRPLFQPLRQAVEVATREQLTLCEPIWLRQVVRLVPDLAPGLELQVPGGTTGEDASAVALMEGLARFLLTLASQRPVCLVLDDLHWADTGTGEFLSYLYRRLHETPLLLVGAYRDGEIGESPWLAAAG